MIYVFTLHITTSFIAFVTPGFRDRVSLEVIFLMTLFVTSTHPPTIIPLLSTFRFA